MSTEAHWRFVVLTWHGWIAFFLHLGFVLVFGGLFAAAFALGAQAGLWNRLK